MPTVRGEPKSPRLSIDTRVTEVIVYTLAHAFVPEFDLNAVTHVSEASKDKGTLQQPLRSLLPCRLSLVA